MRIARSLETGQVSSSINTNPSSNPGGHTLDNEAKKLRLVLKGSEGDSTGATEQPKSGFEDIGREALQGFGERFKKAKERLGKIACKCVGILVVGARRAKENNPAQLSEELLYLPPGETERVGILREKVEVKRTVAAAENIAAKGERDRLKNDHLVGKEARQHRRKVNKQTLNDLSEQQQSDENKLFGLRKSHYSGKAGELWENVETASCEEGKIERVIAERSEERLEAKAEHDRLLSEVEQYKATGREHTPEFIEISNQLADAEYRMNKAALAIKRDLHHLNNAQRITRIYSSELSKIQDMEERRFDSISELKEAAIKRKAARRDARRDTWKSHVEGVRSWFKTGLSLAKTTKVGRMFARLKRGQ